MTKATKVLAGLASLTLLDIAAASAQPAPVYNWTGFYIGGHAGARWSTIDVSAPSANVGDLDLLSLPPVNDRYNLSGAIGGFQAGYNFMLSPNILAGIEGDWSWGKQSKSAGSTVSGTDDGGDGYTFTRTAKVELEWQASLRARLGFVNGPWLFYGTGGVAFTHVNFSEYSELDSTGDVFGFIPSAWSGSKTLTGAVVGVGAEYLFANNWTGRVEYLYEMFGSFDVNTGPNPDVGKVDVKDVSKIRVGINYKFTP
jgi:outer membrane immunogenic protein